MRFTKKLFHFFAVQEHTVRFIFPPFTLLSIRSKTTPIYRKDSQKNIHRLIHRRKRKRLESCRSAFFRISFIFGNEFY